MSTSDRTSLRNIASDWHGGQSSALYAFASTGTIVSGLEAEVRHCLRELVAGQYRSDEVNVETPRLSALLDYVVTMTAAVAEAGYAPCVGTHDDGTGCYGPGECDHVGPHAGGAQ
jgi:hypothetical protein